MAGKNTHMDHLEDAIILYGTQGGKDAIKFLKSMGQFLSGKGGNIKVTTKWDGAPAVVCGTDPEDGQFFVGTKAVFGKNDPKRCKSIQDCHKWYNGALAQKLADSYEHLKKAQIKGILQGDLMFTNDKKKERIDGEPYITFRPNTITYAAHDKSDLARDIERAKLGIVFHTKYEGNNWDTLKSSFNVTDQDFKANDNVWIQKAEFKDIGGVAALTQKEKLQYEAAIRKAEGSLYQTKGILDKIQSGKKALKIDTEFLKFFNNYVKEDRNIPSVEQAYKEFLFYLGKEYDKAITKNKTLKAQAAKADMFMQDLFYIVDKKNAPQFKMLIATYMNLQFCKNILVQKMKKVSSMRLFVDMGNGDYKATTPEGFVGIQGEKAMKLVDRMEFSKLNFTVPKVWG